MLPASYQWPRAEVLSRLVRDAQRQEAAVESLLAAIRPALVAFFRQKNGGDLAEDLTQLALIRISGAVSRIDPERADSYLSAVARNLLRTNYRRAARDRSRIAEVEEAEDIASDTAVDMRAEYTELVRAVHRACVAMEKPELRAVAFGVLAGESASDLAARLDVNPITVRTRLMRVRAILRQELSAYRDDSWPRRREA